MSVEQIQLDNSRNNNDNNSRKIFSASNEVTI